MTPGPHHADVEAAKAYAAAETVLLCDESPMALRVKAGLMMLEAKRAAEAALHRQSEQIKTMREALTLARGWLSGWASASSEIAAIDDALQIPEEK